jgi:hypothetical protein
MFEKYFQILTKINSIHLPPAQIKLLAFVAVKGNISAGTYKEQFCIEQGIPRTSLGNLISKLSKKGWLVKKDRKIVLNPAISVQSCSNMILNITLNAETSEYTDQGLVDEEDSRGITSTDGDSGDGYWSSLRTSEQDG